MSLKQSATLPRARLALAGEAGVREVIRNLVAELDLTLALTGCRSVGELGPQHLEAAPGGGGD